MNKDEKKTTSETPSVGEAEERIAMPAVLDEGKKGKAVNPEITAGKRRRFSAAYKLKILEEIDACQDDGGIGAVLRREGLYSSYLTTWREQRKNGELAGLAPGKRGRKPPVPRALAQRVALLEKENLDLKQRLQQAETVIDVQKKVSALFGVTPSCVANIGIGS